jgi:hypothetical protein
MDYEDFVVILNYLYFQDPTKHVGLVQRGPYHHLIEN